MEGLVDKRHLNYDLREVGHEFTSGEVPLDSAKSKKQPKCGG